MVSDLFPGKVIGFGIILGDTEPSIRSEPKSAFGLTPFSENRWESSTWSEGLLVGTVSGTNDTAARDVTWGRIKASLELE